MPCRSARYAVTLATLATLATIATASPAAAQLEARGSVGALGLRALTLEFDGNEDTGNLFGIGGELLLNRRWVGVAQAEFLQTSSLAEASESVNSAFALMGGLGVRLGVPGVERMTVDLLGYAGYAQIDYSAVGSDFTDASPQFGVGITPRFALSDRVAITLAVRTLVGSEVGEGSAINRTDVGLGGWVQLF